MCHLRTHAPQQTTKIYSITSYSFDVRFGKVNELKDGQLVLQRNVFVEAQGFAFERMDTFEACSQRQCLDSRGGIEPSAGLCYRIRRTTGGNASRGPAGPLFPEISHANFD